jgi:para-aminobenzoate synthetase component I
MNMFTTQKSATRSDVWRKFLELRAAEKEPVLLDTAANAGGRSLIFVPGEGGEQGRDLADSEAVWAGFYAYDQGLEWMGVESRQVRKLPGIWWKKCNEVYEFEVVTEDGEEFLAGLRAGKCDFSVGKIEAGISKEEYLAAIAEIKQALRDGETYQVNFAQELRAKFEGDAFGLYAAMFSANPSAMCFFAEQRAVDGGLDFAVCSNSPERLFSLRKVGGEDPRFVLRTEPIKGTVAADEDPEFLLRDPKSYAELTMIVDLMRNDFGKVARSGSVKVLEHQALMKLANVWHAYSVVEAELADDFVEKKSDGLEDVLTAVFPGGSVTGCPKKRTMEIIDRLENFSRGAYCGSAGYVRFGEGGQVEEADFNIMIRTATIFGGRDDVGAQVNFPVGGGIVWDSDAEAEYEETLDKGKIFVSLGHEK